MVRHGASPLFAFQIFQIFVVLQTKLLEGGAHVLDIETQFSVGQSFAFRGFLGQSLSTCSKSVIDRPVGNDDHTIVIRELPPDLPVTHSYNRQQ
jgi:hypothetical protein